MQCFMRGRPSLGKVRKPCTAAWFISCNGKGMIARDQMKNEGVEDLHSKQEGRNETRILLERYDMVRQ